MKNNKWLKFKSYTSAFLVLTTIMIGTVANTFAAEQTVPQISKWAISTLNEGEKYGIFPINWYYDGFQDPISQDKLKIILDGTSKKIEALNLKTNDSFVAKEVGKDITKGNIVISLYNILAKYQLPKTLEIDKYSPSEYMQKRGILSGNDKGLELESNCTVEQTAILATKLVEDTYKELGAGSKGLFWKATKGENTMYLLGSIHIGTPDLYPLSNKLKEAFKQSDELLVEANILVTENLQGFLEKAMYSDGTTLKDHVSAETYEKALKVFDKFGLPKEQYVKFKPWSIANDLTVLSSSNSSSMQEASQAANLGLDLYFMTTALMTNKPIVELESVSYQAELFDNLSNEIKEKNLNDALDALLNPKTDSTVDDAKLINLWQTQWNQGDIENFTKSYSENLKESESEFTKMLLGTRDKNMANKLAELLDKEGKSTYFVVVGAAHLAVEDMVIDQLKAKGYDVQAVK